MKKKKNFFVNFKKVTKKKFEKKNFLFKFVKKKKNFLY